MSTSSLMPISVHSYTPIFSLSKSSNLICKFATKFVPFLWSISNPDEIPALIRECGKKAPHLWKSCLQLIPARKDKSVLSNECHWVYQPQFRAAHINRQDNWTLYSFVYVFCLVLVLLLSCSHFFVCFDFHFGIWLSFFSRDCEKEHEVK